MAECPGVVYQQGQANFCAAYGAASAMKRFGCDELAERIAAAAPAALESGDAFGAVRDLVHSVPGWEVIALKSHDPLEGPIAEPVLMQLGSSDGGHHHAVASCGDLVFDSAESRALPLTRESLDRCIGQHINGARFMKVVRAVRFMPGRSARKQLNRERCVAETSVGAAAPAAAKTVSAPTAATMSSAHSWARERGKRKRWEEGSDDESSEAAAAPGGGLN